MKQEMRNKYLIRIKWFIYFYIKFIIITSAQDNELAKYIKNQIYKPGDDGFITYVSSPNIKTAIYDSLRIIHINGILNTYNEAINNAIKISKQIGRKVILLYSKSSKNKESALEAISDLNDAMEIDDGHYIASVESLKALVSNQLTRGYKVRIIAHSRGALITYKAISTMYSYYKEMDKLKILNQLEVITLGGFSPSISQWPGIGIYKVYALINPNDIVPHLYDKVQKIKAGEDMTRTFSSEEQNAFYIQDHILSSYIPILDRFKYFNIKK